MIKKIVTIRNVGRLERCNAYGDLTFRKLTVIYAENGRGKTTLTDVLRSLSTGSGELIVGRKTLGSGLPPSATVLINTDAVVRAGLPVGFKLDAFLALGPDSDVATKITAKQAEIAGLDQAKEIKDKAAIALVALSQLPPNFETLLARASEY